MDTVQVQVQINDTKRVLFTPEPNTYTELVDVIRTEIPKTRTIDINLLYENDEGEYVVMNSHDLLCLRTAFAAAKTIPGTEVRRLKICVFEGSSPSIKVAAANENDAKVTKYNGMVCKVAQRPYNQIARKRICLEQRLPESKNPLTLGGNESEASEYSSDDDVDNSNPVDAFNEKTPLERYVENTEIQIKSKSDLLASLKEKESAIRKNIDRVKSNPLDGNICRCCHMRLGHTSRSCTFGKCSSVFKCGEEKFHAGE
jgi:hypothetical protein